jgi:hypothetical protein
MSLLPNWYSTIFGVQLFSASFDGGDPVAAMVLITYCDAGQRA